MVVPNEGLNPLVVTDGKSQSGSAFTQTEGRFCQDLDCLGRRRVLSGSRGAELQASGARSHGWRKRVQCPCLQQSSDLCRLRT